MSMVTSLVLFACNRPPLRRVLVARRSQRVARVWKRARTLFRRYIWPRGEHFFDLDLRQTPSAPLARRALLSYIVHPFTIDRDDPRFLRHINIFHAQEMVRSLNQLGYRVDVIDYRDTKFTPNHTYDLFIGHGGVNFATLAQHLPPTTPRIYLATGSYWRFHNRQELARCADLERRRGVRLEPDRPVAEAEEQALHLADGILGIGNGHTRSTYQGFERVEMIDGTALADLHFDLHPKDYPAGRQHFLFFASTGNLHKGLDLLLEAFTGLEQHLWVVAPLEPSFTRLYSRELEATPNIHRIGWLQPRSARFYDLVQTCSFCILPSCSEGQAQSVVEAMNQGLVPIVSRESGLDVDGLGLWLEPVTVEEIRRVVQAAASLPTEHIQALARRARQAAQERYAEPRFGQNFSRALARLLEKSTHAAGG